MDTKQGPAIKEQLADPGNYGGERTADQIRYLVIHYTGNDGDTAANNAAYYQRTVVQASAHYFVDDTAIYRSVPDLCVAWAVGGEKYADVEETGGGTMYHIISNSSSDLPGHGGHAEKCVRLVPGADGEVSYPARERLPALRRDREALPGLLHGSGEVGGVQEETGGVGSHG